jgi:hypothetical protein
MKMTIDRIEGAVAILISREETPQKVNMPLSLLPLGSREGDVITVAIERDEDATAEARERVSSILENLKKKHRE